MTPRVIVTRPQAEAADWVARLGAEGVQAEALPLIAIAPLRPAGGLPALANYDACLFVSGNAARHFFEQYRPPAQSERAQSAIKIVAKDALLPARLRLLAPGPGTASVLRDCGVPDAQIDKPADDALQFDSQALWQQIGNRDWAGRRVLVVRGQSGSDERAGIGSAAPGRDWIAAQWQRAGAEVDFVGVYQRLPPQLSAAQRQRAEAASADGSVWLFSSSEAIAHLLAASVLDWRRARALATHPRIAETARRAGWEAVHESRPALGDIVRALRSIEWPGP